MKWEWGAREGRKKIETLKKVDMIQFTAFSLRKTLQKEIVSCQPRENPSFSLGHLAGPFHVHPHASLLLPPTITTPTTYLHWRQNQRWYQRAGCGLQTRSWWLSSVDRWRLVKWSAEPDTHRTFLLVWPRQRGGVSWLCASQLQGKNKAKVRPLWLAEPSWLLTSPQPGKWLLPVSSRPLPTLCAVSHLQSRGSACGIRWCPRTTAPIPSWAEAP